MEEKLALAWRHRTDIGEEPGPEDQLVVIPGA